MTSPSLRICDDYRLELSAFARTGLRVGIWASSGRGKSFGVGVFCEELLSAGVPVIAIDPEGELHTLREQFRALVLGGVHGDLALPTTPAGIRAALERALDAGIGLVVDLSDLARTKAQQEAAKPWLEQLWGRMSERHAPAALVVEEVHLFAPQSGSAVTADMMQRFAKQGRKRGVILVAASQRTQAVSKEFMSQLNFPAIGGFETERDYDAVREVVDGHPFEDFRALSVGQFFLPAAGGFHRWRARRTSHGGDAPTWANDAAHATTRHDEALDALIAELRKALEEEEGRGAAPEPPDAARTRIRQLEDELRRSQRALTEAQAEVERLNLALQVAGVVKVIIRQEVVTQMKEAAPAPAPAPAPAFTPAPAPAFAPAAAPPPAPAAAPPLAPAAAPVAVVKTEVRPAEASLQDAGINTDKLLDLEPVKKMIQLARGRARRRAPRSGAHVLSAARTLAKGWNLSAVELAARSGYHGKVTINRISHALNALAEVGFAIVNQGRYRLNDAAMRRFVVGG